MCAQVRRGYPLGIQNSILERFPSHRTQRVGTAEKVCRTGRAEAGNKFRGQEGFYESRKSESLGSQENSYLEARSGLVQ